MVDERGYDEYIWSCNYVRLSSYHEGGEQRMTARGRPAGRIGLHRAVCRR